MLRGYERALGQRFLDALPDFGDGVRPPDDGGPRADLPAQRRRRRGGRGRDDSGRSRLRRLGARQLVLARAAREASRIRGDAVRVGFIHYNTVEEVDGFTAALAQALVSTNRCSCHTRTRTLSCVGRAARRSAAARPSRHRRRRRRARRELRGQGVWGAHRDGWPAGASRFGPTRSSCGRASPLTQRQASVMFPVFEDALARRRGAVDRRSVPRRARDGADRGTPVADRRAAARRECASASGSPVTVGVARTKFLAKVASGVAKPDGLLVVPPERELEFLHPLPVECVWGVGPATAKRLQAWNVRDRRRARGAVGADARRDPRPRRPVGTCTRSRTTVTSGGCEAGRRRGSIGSQRALGRGRHSAEAVDATLVGHRRPRSRGGCGRRAGSGGPSCCAFGSATSSARRARTRSRFRRRARRRSSSRRARSSRRRLR